VKPPRPPKPDFFSDNNQILNQQNPLQNCSFSVNINNQITENNSEENFIPVKVSEMKKKFEKK
jgi:hypothetical protein